MKNVLLIIVIVCIVIYFLIKFIVRKIQISRLTKDQRQALSELQKITAECTKIFKIDGDDYREPNLSIIIANRIPHIKRFYEAALRCIKIGLDEKRLCFLVHGYRHIDEMANMYLDYREIRKKVLNFQPIS